MEILKFSEPPKRSSRSSSAKRSGLMPMVTFGIAVLVLGGMSTTLAGTISLNSGGTVEFGQGVVTTAACDTSLSVTPTSTYETSTSVFKVNKVTISNVGALTGTNGTGCMGKYFKITAYDSMTVTQITPTGASATDFVWIKLPGTAGSSDTSTVSNKTQYSSKTTGLTIDDVTGTWTTTQSTGSAAGTIIIGGLSFSGTVEKITIESSDSEPTA